MTGHPATTGTDRSATAPLLAAERLSHHFGDFVAVADVSLAVRPGEVVGLLGANGAGKTTVIRILLGLLLPTSGSVSLLGSAPSRDGRAHIGYVPQGLGLYESLTVSQNLGFAADAYHVPAAELTGVLAEHADTLVGDLSLGLQRQLAFMEALQHSPDVLVLDEPTSGVAPLARARLWETIRDQADRGVGVLVTTHYMQEAQQCDRLLLMSRGQLVAQGSEADLISGTTAVEVTATSWTDAFTVLVAANQPVTLVGRVVRVADGDRDVLRGILADAGIEAELRAVPATIEERMTVLARQQEAVYPA